MEACDVKELRRQDCLLTESLINAALVKKAVVCASLAIVAQTSEVGQGTIGREACFLDSMR